MRVILVTNHTQNGTQFKPGDEIEMSLADAVWYRTAVLDERFAKSALVNTPLGQAALTVLGGTNDAPSGKLPPKVLGEKNNKK
jgi:hypothetical protein